MYRVTPPFVRLARSLSAIVAFALVQALPASAQGAMDGEYGLRVTDVDGEIGVAWLTAEPQEGRLRVTAGDSVLLDVHTQAAVVHHATFPRPNRDVELAYGGIDDVTLHHTTVFLSPEPPPESGELSGIDSLYVVGDIHGEYDRLRALLTNAGLVDSETHWTGGIKHVVFLGDLFDRGPDVTRTLWLVYRLEREARAAGGGAHVVLGNHETMIFTEDLRYVSDKEQLVARLHGVTYTKMFDIRTTVLGRWLATRPGVMRIDGALLAHGGVVPELVPHSVTAVNDSLRAFMAEELFYRWADTTLALANDSATAEAAGDQYDTVIVMDSAAVARRTRLIFDERSIFWYRGYVQSDTLTSALEQTLRNFDAEVHIVGHTPVPTISSRYEGRLLAVDMEDAASEMLLLTKDAQGRYREERLSMAGPPEPIY